MQYTASTVFRACMSDPICIVGYGCLLPEANNPEEFWTIINGDRPVISKLPNDRLNHDLYNPNSEVKVASPLAAFVTDEQIEQAIANLGLDKDCLHKTHTRQHILSLEACRQTLSNVKYDDVDIVCGISWFDEERSTVAFIDDKHLLLDEIGDATDKKAIDQYFVQKSRHLCAKDQSIFATSALHKISNKFDITGSSFFVDAACASSVAAIDVAKNRLEQKRTSSVLVGGLDCFLGPELHAVFTATKTHATKHCLPFDKRSEGLIQGEGSVFFMLQKESVAKTLGNTIYGYLGDIKSASSASRSSLFASCGSAQKEVLSDVSYDYVECHGTGTQAGDKIELETLDAHLQKKTCAASVKFYFGHTKATAGATALLKVLQIAQHGSIPAVPYMNEPCLKTRHVIFNDKPMPVDTNHFLAGISSFGFGGINYHMTFHKSKETLPAAADQKRQALVLCQASSTYKATVDDALFFKVSPHSLVQTDHTQLQAIHAAYCAMQWLAKKANKPYSEILEKTKQFKPAVISASSTGLKMHELLGKRVKSYELHEHAKNQQTLQVIQAYREKFPEITEDMGAGSLNNVIAGRVCSYFDFRGANFNVDNNFASVASALEVAQDMINDLDVVFVLAVHEHLADDPYELVKDAVTCTVVCSQRFADALSVENFSDLEVQHEN